MTTRRFTFPRSSRLRGKLGFAAVYDRGIHVARGPVKVFAVPNGGVKGAGRSRLGLSVSRRVGTAPRRNAIKRRLREAFRLMQHDLPAGYDFVIVVRPHAPMRLAEYQKLLSSVFVKLHNAWQTRRAAEGDTSAADR